MKEKLLNAIPHIIFWSVIIGILYFWAYPKYIKYKNKDVSVVFNKEAVTPLEYLATLKVELSDFYSSKKIIERKIIGSNRKIKGFIKFKGEAKIGIDFKKIIIKTVDKKNKTVKVILPNPEIIFFKLNAKIPFEKIIWNSLSSQEKVDYLVTARVNTKKDMIKELKKDKILIEHAKERAEKLIRSFYKKLGWKIKFISHSELKELKL